MFYNCQSAFHTCHLTQSSQYPSPGSRRISYLTERSTAWQSHLPDIPQQVLLSPASRICLPPVVGWSGVGQRRVLSAGWSSSIGHVPSPSNPMDSCARLMASPKYLCHNLPHRCIPVQTVGFSPLPTVLFISPYSPAAGRTQRTDRKLFLKHKYGHVTLLPRFLQWLLRTVSRVWSGLVRSTELLLSSQVLPCNPL